MSLRITKRKAEVKGDGEGDRVRKGLVSNALLSSQLPRASRNISRAGYTASWGCGWWGGGL